MLEYINGTNPHGVYMLSEFIDEVNRPCVNPKNQSVIDKFSDRRNNQLGWFGLQNDAKEGEGHQSATERLCREGWPRGLELVEQIGGDIISPTPISIRRVGAWRGQGDELDQQKVWQGNLDSAWRTTVRDKRFGPTRVRLLVNSLEFGACDELTMRWRGAVAAKAADVLAEAGYSVQIESCFKTVEGDTEYKLQVIVKPYESPVDLPVLCSSTVLPAFFRSLGHVWGTKVAKEQRDNVGYPSNNFEASDFIDATDSAMLFVVGRDIVDVSTANQRLKHIVSSVDGALLKLAA